MSLRDVELSTLKRFNDKMDSKALNFVIPGWIRMNSDILHDLLPIKVYVLCLKYIYIPNIFAESILLNNFQKRAVYKLILHLIPNYKAKLLYRASEHGFCSKNFHSHCDFHSNTLTIIKTIDDTVFGCYTSVPWSRDGNYHYDSKSFIFNITNQKVFNINPNSMNYAVFHRKSSGPIFGFCEIEIPSYFNTFPSMIKQNNVFNIQSKQLIGDTYQKINDNQYTFHISNMEVFEIL